MVVLDTRNKYEVSLGTFKNAIDPEIESFEEFTQYVDVHKEELKKKPVVTFCTGGIRCEKATAYMMQQGIDDVYQLEGGILKYFEATQGTKGPSHWNGDCVVFDKRKAIDSELRPSKKSICYVCLYEMTKESKHPQPGPGGELCKSCAEKIAEHKEKRQNRGKEKAALNRKLRAEICQKTAAHFRQLGLRPNTDCSKN